MLLFRPWPSVSSDSFSISLTLHRSAFIAQLQSQPWPLRTNSPYAFFCPDQRWPGLKDNPNTRRSLGTCPDGYAALLKPVVAWPGDTVTTSPAGVAVNGRPVPNSAPLMRDSLGRELHPYPYGTYEVLAGQIWVVSSYSSKSFDSRYFGPVPLKTVREWVRPLITERYHAH